MRQQKVIVVGAGTMGHSIAQVFATYGHSVTVVDAAAKALEKAKAMVAENLALLSAEGIISRQTAAEAQQRISYAQSLEPAAKNATFVIEAIFESPEAKIKLFAELDKLCPADAILASNTSSLNIYDFIQVSHPERLIIAHWFNPAHIIPLIEIVRGPQTSDAIVQNVKELMLSMDKKPVILNKPVPGFIINRLTAALSREASYMVAQGWTTTEDIDTAIVANYGPKFAFEGVFELMDHIGWDVSMMAGRFLAPHLCNTPVNFPQAEEMLQKGWFGLKSGRGLKDYSGMNPADVTNARNLKILKAQQAQQKLASEK